MRNSYKKSSVQASDILAGKAVAVSSAEMDKISKVTLIKRSDIPAVVYSWVRQDFVNITDVDVVVDENLVITTDDNKRYVYASYCDKAGNPVVHHVTFMNFRRYGWCASSGYNADSGYCGSVYANGVTGGLTCKDETTVVRDSMIRAIATLEEVECVPEFLVYSNASRKALDYLYEDAIRNISVHATTPINRPSGPWQEPAFEEITG